MIISPVLALITRDSDDTTVDPTPTTPPFPLSIIIPEDDRDVLAWAAEMAARPDVVVLGIAVAEPHQED